MPSCLSIGLMSGTSMDGIDAALLKTDGREEIIELDNIDLSYKTETKRLLKAAELALKKAEGNLSKAKSQYLQALEILLTKELQLDRQDATKEISALTEFLSRLNLSLDLESVIEHSTILHAEAVALLLKKTQYDAKDITVIGYHGQTLYHSPTNKISIQAGDGKLLAAMTGIKVVNNFRSNDIAHGGQGAPFAPIYHQALAKRDGKIPVAVVNCGGIANISLILGEHLDDITAFDTGPGNGLIDSFVRLRSQGRESMDCDGQYGSIGEVNTDILALLLKKALISDGENYLSKKAPKSLDIRDMVLIPELNSLSIEDGCATLEAFTAETIVRSLDLAILNNQVLPKHWVLAGGGWSNPVIKNELSQRLKNTIADLTIETADEAGWNSKALEAQIFAYFAVRSIEGLPLSTPATTAVTRAVTGGNLHLPPKI